MQLLADPMTPMQAFPQGMPAPVMPHQPQRRPQRPISAPPVIAPPMQPTAPERAPAAPQSNPGGLGGLGGMPAGGDGVGNILQGIGMSLMSSPRNAPLANFPQFFGALQAASEQRQKSAQEMQAMEHVLYEGLKAGGRPEEEARQEARLLAVDPRAAQMRLQQMEQMEQRRLQEAEQARRARANQAAMGVLFPGSDQSAPPVHQSQEGPRTDGVAFPAADPMNEPAGTRQPQATAPQLPTYEEARAALGGGGGQQPQTAQAAPEPTPQMRNDALRAPENQQVRSGAQQAGFNRTQAHYLAVMANPDVDETIRSAAKAEYDRITDDSKLTGNQKEFRDYLNADPSTRDLMREWRRAGSAQTNVNVGGEQTAGWRKIDENFAEEYVRWQGGGFADAAKQMDQLGEALTILESGENVTGAIGAVPEVLQPFINERGTVAREAVEEVVQRNLREILGAQFTEREGERLIARAFNPRLPPQENAKRLRRLIDQVGGMAQAKQSMVDYFNENGTLQGYQGARPNVRDLETIDFGDGPGQPQSGGQSGRGGRVEIDGYVIEEID